MATTWLSTIEACRVLGISQSTLRRRIDKGEIDSKLEDGKRLILVITDNQLITNLPEQALLQQLQDENADLRQQIEYLKEQSSEKDKQIENLQKHLDEASHRHDTVVMQMTKLLEYHQQPFWRKLFSRKALPGAIDEKAMDINPENNKSK